MPRLRVAICGAGVGGLTTALALSKYEDIAVDLYEGASQLAEVGAGIGAFGRPWKVLQKLGVTEDLLKTTEEVTSWTYRKADEAEGLDIITLNAGLITLHRADFQNTLVHHLPERYHLHTSKRLQKYVQDSDGVELTFADGSTARCDVLVGADGLKSATRAQLLQDLASKSTDPTQSNEFLSCIPPTWTGMVAYRGLIPSEKLRGISPSHRALSHDTQFIGKNGSVVAYPLMNGTVINVAAIVARPELEGTPYPGDWFKCVEIDELAPTLAHWEPDVQALIQCIEQPLRWAIHAVKPLQTFVSSRVALLGDAAHAMHPNQGSGAGQAIEDALIMATVLGHKSTNKGNLENAISVYDTIRRPFALDVARRSRLQAKMTMFQGEGLPSDFETLEGEEKLQALKQLGKAAQENIQWAWTTSLDDDVERAFHMLESW
ncbi:FAD/NAD(P)-binding domain-containing protein [Cylindrobasidium torrendii FP15055 ss-10]|uniref:FAD/NAD(P)-binding domain-containing protein n=1 Tax=Cylindrobasidium torrendii FP15055 ss-10 TaxID=1314674 RepID=A0A0D7BJV9_9AGAR|nr:FAD/NAD(P)-binding domain-containing protein [Cylindrobasidium torrendii FP15055 ss-10]